MFYQKYRPSTVSDLDNAQIRDTLGKSLLEDKWVQAYLLTGPRGTGKTTTARLIAKIVNCPNRKAGEESCNKCDFCLSITSGNALDVVEIDAASNRGIDEIRSLREQVKLAPSSLKYKVYIIDEVHMLTTEAFNALLKTLEEPPKHVIFVLATTDLNKVPQTVVSRCVHYQFHESTLEETLRSLKRVVNGEKLDINEEALKEISKLSHGSFRDATKILEQVASLSTKITLKDLESLNITVEGNQVTKLLELILTKETSQALSMLESFAQSGGAVKELNFAMIKLSRDVLMQRHGLTTNVIDFKNVTDTDLETLIADFIDAGTKFSLSPIAQLPLELVIVKHSTANKISEPVKEIKPTPKETPAIVEPVKVPIQEKEIKVDKIEPVEEKVISASTASTPVTSVDPGSAGIVGEKWADILLATKPHNHSITAFLKAARPIGFDGEFVIIEVFYKFHKEKLEEQKNRDIVEKVISDIIGKEVKIKFTLGNK